MHADLSTIAGNRAALAAITAATPVVDALALFANRQAPRRVETADGLEATFALYYLSRHLLGRGLTPLLSAGDRPVIVNVAGVGITRGAIAWDDLQLTRGYGMVRAQLQAGRANDLLGVAYAAEHGRDVPYVLYHPGSTRSGDASGLPAPVRAGPAGGGSAGGASGGGVGGGRTRLHRRSAEGAADRGRPGRGFPHAADAR